jgi:hypothetical protein
MKRIFMHVAFFAAALGLTLLVFNFWGDFSRAMYNYMTMVTTPDKPSGVVTMKIIPPPDAPAGEKPACDKKHPCK